MGRDQDHSVRRGVADANLLIEHGVDCSLSSNNILNPATPYGDCSLIRVANLYANVIQLDRPAQLRECFRMLTDRSARLLNFKEYGFAVGHPADVVIIDAQSPEQADRRNLSTDRGIQKGQADGSVGSTQAVASALFCDLDHCGIVRREICSGQ